MDGRGPWDLEGSIREHQEVMGWYGARGIPVELNEPHHWGMRDAPDVRVCCRGLPWSAYNARAFGVRDYIAQLMFNSPPGHSDAMDLAKMLTVLELVAPLAGAGFPHLAPDAHRPAQLPARPGCRARPPGDQHLPANGARPHIVHVVGHTEAHHAATAEDVIEACGHGAPGAIENALRGAPELVEEAKLALGAICNLAGPGAGDPLADPPTLARAVTSGLLDAPQLRNNRYGRGEVVTRIDGRGACVAVDGDGQTLAEAKRLALLRSFG
jgi:hypothetical protein